MVDVDIIQHGVQNWLGVSWKVIGSYLLSLENTQSRSHQSVWHNELYKRPIKCVNVVCTSAAALWWLRMYMSPCYLCPCYKERKGPSHPMTLNFVLEHCVIICKAAISVIRIYHTFPCTLRLSGSEAKIQISLNTT